MREARSSPTQGESEDTEMLRHQPRDATTPAGRLSGSSKLLRAMNESAALAHLLDKGTLTRGGLRELTGLSKPTTSDVLRRLTDAGLAVVVGHTRGGPGPNAEIYAANPAAAHAAAVSVRETADPARPEFTAALVDLAGTVHARARERFDLGGGSPVDAIDAIVRRLSALAELDPDAITHVHLGVPGSYDAAAGVIRHIDVPGFDQVGLVARLAERLGAPVAVENDVNLAAIAERSRGVAAGESGFALLWFGEGLGLAIDLGGALLRGARGGAGEIGYVPVGLPAQGPRDLQELVGGPAVVQLAQAYGLTATNAAAAVAAATAADTPQKAGDGFLSELARRMAHCAGAVAGVLDPPLIVLAGEVAQAGGEELARRVRSAVAETPLDTTIAVTGIADDAVLLGALDAGLRAVRDSLIDALRANIPTG